MNLTMKHIRTLLILILCIAATSGCGRDNDPVFRKSMPLMDTMVSITVVSGSRADAENAVDEAFAVLGRFGDMINFYDEKSELSAINRNAGISKTQVSPETFDVIEKAREIASQSGGAFDPTVGPLVRLWDFVAKKRPTARQIRAALPLVNYRNIVLDRKTNSVFLRKKGMLLDLGGIAKGYGADLAIASLRRSGIRGGLVSVAGDIRTFGKRPGTAGWTVGIRNPRQTGEKDEIIATVLLNDRAISTSGDYERYFISDGKRYHHLLDPKTGYPAPGSRSVSIVAGNTVSTDAWSTAIFVLGPQKGMDLVRKAGLEALVIDAAGNRKTTDGMKEMLKFEKSY